MSADIGIIMLWMAWVSLVLAERYPRDSAQRAFASIVAGIVATFGIINLFAGGVK